MSKKFIFAHIFYSREKFIDYFIILLVKMVFCEFYAFFFVLLAAINL